MLTTSLTIGYLFISIAIGLCLYRVIKGPSTPDRIVALDLVAGLSLVATGLMAIDSGKSLYIDIAVVVALLAFLSTVAFARYLEQKLDTH